MEQHGQQASNKEAKEATRRALSRDSTFQDHATAVVLQWYYSGVTVVLHCHWCYSVVPTRVVNTKKVC
jgi:hypothetical protein